MTKTASRPSLRLDLQAGDDFSEADLIRLAPVWQNDRARLRRLALAALTGRCETALLTLRMVGADEGLALNRDYRLEDSQTPYATNVLTFGYSEGPDLSADLVFCLPVIEREAAERGLALRDHLAHLVVHGCLHAAGLDHLDDEEAEQMEAEEARLLARFRISNPYESGCGTLDGSQQPLSSP